LDTYTPTQLPLRGEGGGVWQNPFCGLLINASPTTSDKRISKRSKWVAGLLHVIVIRQNFVVNIAFGAKLNILVSQNIVEIPIVPFDFAYPGSIHFVRVDI
jgi:hypothetical protein